MWPGKVPSDLDVEEQEWDDLAGRWTILVDVASEMQGECGAYLIFALLIPGLMAASAVFGWTARPGLMLVGAAALFLVLGTISLHSYVWYRWARKRNKKVRSLMDRMLAEDQVKSVR